MAFICSKWYLFFQNNIYLNQTDFIGTKMNLFESKTIYLKKNRIYFKTIEVYLIERNGIYLHKKVFI